MCSNKYYNILSLTLVKKKLMVNYLFMLIVDRKTHLSVNPMVFQLLHLLQYIILHVHLKTMGIFLIIDITIY